jgi:amino acid transporter
LSISPTSASLSAASSALSSGLVGGIPGTSFTVSGVQVVQNGVETVSEEKSTRNLGLIIGLTVGLVALGTFFLYIVVVIIVVVVLVKRRMAAAAQSMTVHSFNAG